MQHINPNLTIAAKSILNAFGGSGRFGRPPQVTRSGARLIGAFVRDGSPMAAIEGDMLSADIPVPFARLTGEAAGNVVRILDRCLTPENIRITVGDVVRINGLQDPVLGVISDVEGVALHVDGGGMLIENVPLPVIFGMDDFDVVGHREFTRGLLDFDTPAESWSCLRDEVARQGRTEPCHKTYPYPGGGSALERLTGGSLVNGTVVEYQGIEALVYGPPGRPLSVHPVHAFQDEDGSVRTATAEG